MHVVGGGFWRWPSKAVCLHFLCSTHLQVRLSCKEKAVLLSAPLPWPKRWTCLGQISEGGGGKLWCDAAPGAGALGWHWAVSSWAVLVYNSVEGWGETGTAFSAWELLQWGKCCLWSRGATEGFLFLFWWLVAFLFLSTAQDALLPMHYPACSHFLSGGSMESMLPYKFGNLRRRGATVWRKGN